MTTAAARDVCPTHGILDDGVALVDGERDGRRAGRRGCGMSIDAEGLAEQAHGAMAYETLWFEPHGLTRDWDDIEDWERDNLTEFAGLVAAAAIGAERERGAALREAGDDLARFLRNGVWDSPTAENDVGDLVEAWEAALGVAADE